MVNMQTSQPNQFYTQHSAQQAQAQATQAQQQMANTYNRTGIQARPNFQSRPLMTNTLMAPQLQVPQLSSSLFQGFSTSIGQISRPSGYSNQPNVTQGSSITYRTSTPIQSHQNSNNLNQISTHPSQSQNFKAQQMQHSSDVTFHSGHSTNDPEIRRMKFDKEYPRVMPQEKLQQQSKFDAALASMKREGPVKKLPGADSSNIKCAIGILDGKIIIRGSKEALDKLKRNVAFQSSDIKENIVFVEEAAAPSEWLVAFDFDKTLIKNFLWAELGGLQGATIQKNALQQWVRDGRLKNAFGGDERLQELRQVIESRLNRGDFVCVLSSGFASVIRIALQHVGLSDILPTDLIFGCETGPYGISKSSRLEKLKGMFKRQRSVLVDDDLNYCRQAHRDGHKVIWVRDQCGMASREFNRLLTDRWDSTEFLDSQGRVGG